MEVVYLCIQYSFWILFVREMYLYALLCVGILHKIQTKYMFKVTKWKKYLSKAFDLC